MSKIRFGDEKHRSRLGKEINEAGKETKMITVKLSGKIKHSKTKTGMKKTVTAFKLFQKTDREVSLSNKQRNDNWLTGRVLPGNPMDLERSGWKAA